MHGRTPLRNRPTDPQTKRTFVSSTDLLGILCAARQVQLRKSGREAGENWTRTGREAARSFTNFHIGTV